MILIFFASQDAIYEQKCINFIQELALQVLDDETVWLQESRNTDLTKEQYIQLGTFKLADKATIVGLHIQAAS
jgi:hypothetical protein